MNKVKLHTLWLLGMLFLMTACGDDDDYYYPSVKLEFVTVKAGADGLIQSLLPDKGELLTVARDRTGSTISPNSARRVISNYEVNPEDARLSYTHCSRWWHRSQRGLTTRLLKAD